MNTYSLPDHTNGENINKKRTFNHILILGYDKQKQDDQSTQLKLSHVISQTVPFVEQSVIQSGALDSFLCDENISSKNEGRIVINTAGSPATSISPASSPTPGGDDRIDILSNENTSQQVSDHSVDSIPCGVFHPSMVNSTAIQAPNPDECGCDEENSHSNNDVNSVLEQPLLQDMVANGSEPTSRTSIPECYFMEKKTRSRVSIMGTATQNAQISRDEVCSRNLKPAAIPRNPLDDEWEITPALTKELAWILEESLVLLPPEMDVPLLPFVIDFAWRHGSLGLRQSMWETYPSKRCTFVRALHCYGDGAFDAESSVVDGRSLLKLCNITENERFVSLRTEATNALKLGYRRSDSIEKELNVICGYKWRDAVEEVGESGIGIKPVKSRRLKKKCNVYEKLLHSAPDNNKTDADLLANIPSHLTPLEEELAWLAEESLILLPRGMIDNTPQSNSVNCAVTETVISAGSVSKSKEIDWEYVERNASATLKDALERIGGIHRRPLQRLVRTHDREVSIAFQRRREDVATLLLLRGYRREETRFSLPSHELLVHTGLDKVWSVRLARRRQNNACDKLFCDIPKSVPSPKRRRISSPKTERTRSSILTAEEEEIAWLREEYEYETGIKCYDWDYIEENSSARLRKQLKEKKCNLSRCPSIPGVSRLHAMVRLALPSVNDAFERARVNIRYAITQCGFRRALGKSLPVIPNAPTSAIDLPVVRKNGTNVMDIEYSQFGHHDDKIYYSGDDSKDGSDDVYQDEKAASTEILTIGDVKDDYDAKEAIVCSEVRAAAAIKKQGEHDDHSKDFDENYRDDA